MQCKNSPVAEYNMFERNYFECNIKRYRKKLFTACRIGDYNNVVPKKARSVERSARRMGCVSSWAEQEREGIGVDIKELIKKAVDSISEDKSLQEKFQMDPVKALEGILGVDLPDDVVNQVVQGVKAKLTADNVSGAVDALKGFLKK